MVTNAIALRAMVCIRSAHRSRTAPEVWLPWKPFSLTSACNSAKSTWYSSGDSRGAPVTVATRSIRSRTGSRRWSIRPWPLGRAEGG
ncbi:hypothetical protein B4N89_07445 [Embleya scabrispora]|uniref:Uncharacterized protein n=1 Tax=Embleya scabrispora TaxID=159449 RepID=A0A1T3NVC2_9ACTN|nr:hypothetical protein B4N89_07445 [Embleya scabrispora]